MRVDLGVGEKGRKESIRGLEVLLATTYALYLKTQNCHWNVVGPEFFSLHLLFEKQYTEMADAVDEIAERIRSLGGVVDGTLSGFAKLSQLRASKKGASSREMLKELLEGHEAVAQLGRPWISKMQGWHDEASADLLIKRLGVHEKAAWMLRSQSSS